MQARKIPEVCVQRQVFQVQGGLGPRRTKGRWARRGGSPGFHASPSRTRQVGTGRRPSSKEGPMARDFPCFLCCWCDRHGAGRRYSKDDCHVRLCVPCACNLEWRRTRKDTEEEQP